MKTVVIFGGSGFVGRHIIRIIAKNGHKIIIPHQGQVNEAKLRLLGITGQIIPFNFKKLSDKKLLNLINLADVIINLRTLWDEKRTTYLKGILNFNTDLVDIVKNSKKSPQFIYFSGLGIDKKSDSKRTYAIFQSEKYIQNNLKNSIIVRPGIIIGGGDKFLKSLIPLFKLSFFIPLFGNGTSKFQPIFIDDVSIAINKIIESALFGNHIFEFAGSEIFSYREFYEYLSICMNKTRVFVTIPFFVARITVSVLEKTPLSPINSEQLRLFETDNLSSNNHKKIQDLQIKPQDLKEIIKKIVIKNI